MAGTVNQVRIGPVWVTFGNTDVGFTKGGTTITRQFMTQEIVVQGVPQAIVCIRKETLVEVFMAETSYSKFQTLLNMALHRGDDLLTHTNTLVLTALNNPVDITTIPSAFPVGNTSGVPFMLDRERVWPVQFRAIYTTDDLYFSEIS